MQPSHAVSQTAASGQSIRWRFTLLPASFIFVVSIPVLVLSQRSSRSSPRGSAHGFRSGANVFSSGQARLYDDLQRNSGETNSMIQRNTQQLGALQVSNAPAAAYSSSFSQSPQQAWPAVVSSVPDPSTPALARTPRTAEANSYSFRGSAAGSHLSSPAPINHARPSSRTNGTTGIALVAPQPGGTNVPYDGVASINSFSGNPAFQRNSVPPLALEGTPYTTVAPSYSVSVARSATDSQRLYGAYTDRTNTREAQSRSASGLTHSPTAPPVGGNIGTQSTFSPMTFSSGENSEASTLSPSSSTIQASPATSTFTPWSLATQQRSEPLNGLGDVFTTRSSTTFQSNYAEAVNPERQRTVTAAQSTLSSPHQRLWMTASGGGSQSSENNRLSDPLPHARGMPSPNSAYVVYTGFEPRQTGNNERASVVTSSSTVTPELRSFVMPPKELVAALDDSRQYVGQPGLEGVTENATLSSSVEKNSASSPTRVYGGTPHNDEESNTASAGKGNVSLHDAKPIGRFSLQHQNKTRPLDSPLRNTTTQESSNHVSGPSELRDAGSSTLLGRESPHNVSAGDTSHSYFRPPPCQLFQGDALLDTNNSPKSTCVDFDGSHSQETTTVPTSVPSLRKPVSPAAEQLSTNFSSGSTPAEDRVKDLIQNDSAKALNSHNASLTTEETVNGSRAGTTAAEDEEVPGSNASPENPDSAHIRVGYIPPEALTASPVGARGRGKSDREQLLYGDLGDYTVDEKDAFVKNLAAFESHGDGEQNLSVTTTSTATTQTYPPFYNPYSDTLDVDDIPDSPYHNYKWAVDPFPSTYSTHSRLENYESEFNNRYYHEERTAPNITWEEYTRRRSEVDDARKREAELQNEGKVGLIESSESLFQGIIGYPNRGRMSRSPL